MCLRAATKATACVLPSCLSVSISRGQRDVVGSPRYLTVVDVEDKLFPGSKDAVPVRCPSRFPWLILVHLGCLLTKMPPARKLKCSQTMINRSDQVPLGEALPTDATSGIA